MPFIPPTLDEIEAHGDTWIDGIGIVPKFDTDPKPLSPRWQKFEARRLRNEPDHVEDVCGIDVPFWD